VNRMRLSRTFAIAVLALASSASGQDSGDFDLTWHTVDAGGRTFSSGGGFELGGTIAQPDASATPMTGGGFELTGGFWPGIHELAPADIDGDGDVDAIDIQVFVAVLLGLDTDPQHMARADLDHSGAADGEDIQPFVNVLLAG
jgi:hypothetical protein